MIFETISESATNGELLLVDGGMCHYHKRRDGWITIREILVLPAHRRRGIGRHLLARMRFAHPDACGFIARCPADLDSNQWYERMGFTLVGTSETKTGRSVNEWRGPLSAGCPDVSHPSLAARAAHSGADLDNHWSHIK